MELIKAVALAFRDDAFFNGVWPEPANSLTQACSNYIEFDVEVEMKSHWSDRVYMDDSYEIENLTHLNWDDEGETITKEEYNQWLADNPNWYEEMMKARQVNIAKIAELNKQIGEMIDQMTELAEEAGLDVSIDLGQHGNLDPNSNWDSSNC